MWVSMIDAPSAGEGFSWWSLGHSNFWIGPVEAWGLKIDKMLGLEVTLQTLLSTSFIPLVETPTPEMLTDQLCLCSALGSVHCASHMDACV